MTAPPETAPAPLTPRFAWWAARLAVEQGRLVFRRDLRRAADPARRAPLGHRMVAAWFLAWVGLLPLGAFSWWTWDTFASASRHQHGAAFTLILWAVLAALSLGLFPWLGLLVAARTAPAVARLFGARWPER